MSSDECAEDLLGDEAFEKSGVDVKADSCGSTLMLFFSRFQSARPRYSRSASLRPAGLLDGAQPDLGVARYAGIRRSTARERNNPAASPAARACLRSAIRSDIGSISNSSVS